MAPVAVSPSTSQTGLNSPAKPVCHIVTPVGMLGYGFNEEWTEAALRRCASIAPTALICDSGPTDSGPSKLALGTTTCPPGAYERDLRKLVRLSVKYHAPITISSAGGDGSNDHVDLFLDIIRKIADEEENRSWQLKAVAIYSEVDNSLVHKRLEEGQITGCGLTMGPEPFLAAMIRNPDLHVLVGGRAYDPAPYVAFAAYHLLEPKYRDITHLSSEALGAIYHMGKILECGGLIDIRPLDPNARCIPLSVAAHTLYEKTRPDLLTGPGGVLDLTTSKYAQLEDGVMTRLSGSTFHLARRLNKPYTVKLEGARVIGYRTVMMGSFNDPILTGQIKPFLEEAKEYARRQNECDDIVDIGFHIYGIDEAGPEIVPNKIFVVAETLAPSQRLATGLASALRVHFSHGAYPGQKATSGNFGMGIGGRFELEVAECAEFSIYHLMTLAQGEEYARGVDDERADGLFHWTADKIGHGTIQDYSLPPEIEGVAAKQDPSNGSKSATTHSFPAQTSSTTQDLKSAKTLVDVAKVVRLKNAGPFEVTLDVMFDDPSVYKAVKSSDILTTEAIVQLYKIRVEDVVWAGFFDAAMAFKATVPRRRDGKPSCSGGFMEDDVHGSQQYGPLRNIVLPEKLIAALQSL